ncbi:MAG: hypothetical protein IJR33_03640 [Clostridia bacterium]|nr:hypothetical protein [Clostridia bacterium]
MKKLNSFLNIMLVLLFCMTLEIPMPAKAANGGQYVPVYLNGSMIVNGGVASDLPDSKVGEKTGKGNKYVPDPNGSFSLNSNADQMSTDVFSYNMFRCFGSGTGDNAVPIDGFSYSGGNSSRRMVNYGAENEADSDGTYSITFGMDGDDEDEDETYNYYIKFDDNPTLKTLASSGNLQFFISGLVVSGHENHSWASDDHCRCEVWVYLNGSEVGYGDGGTSKEGHHLDTLNTGWQNVPTSGCEIYIKVKFSEDGGATGDKVGFCEGLLLFRDKTSPVLTSYAGNYKATVNQNNSKELLMKLGVKNENDPANYYYDAGEYNNNDAAKNSREWVDMQFDFSKPVTIATPNASGGLISAGAEAYEALANHSLFTNTVGTGYIGEGEQRGLKLMQSSSDVNSYVSSISYRYTATYGDFSGNLAIPARGGIESNSGYSYGSSLLSKISDAGFHDAAGNPLTGIDGSKGNNIFDKNDGGYDVIVDAVPPTYSRVGNGVFPDILTDVILNKNDTVDFIVSFSEATIAKRGWADKDTYLLLDNGGTASYVGKSADKKRWTFRYNIPEGEGAEATLLKVIAVLNTAQGNPNGGNGPITSGSNYAARAYNLDGRTISDYVGNMMVERANEDPSNNTKQINSFTGWAGIAVDNTVPDFLFRYMPYGSGTMTYPEDENSWGQAVTVYTSATDPDVRVANYDPDYSSTNKSRPSKGIYRPDNTTGSAGSAVGLIFYTWTRSPQAPGTGENFEAVKRYSLTGEQPSTVTSKAYASEWQDYTLTMANNYYNILPPDEAMTSDGDGAWYLHVWTADMTWDSARQLMQYDLAQAQQYKDNGSGKLHNADSMLKIKSEMVEEYHSANSSTSYDYAWEMVRADVYQQVYTTQFLCWLAKIDYSAPDMNEKLQSALQQDAMYSDEAMAYARAQATLTQAAYDDTSVWQLDMFSREDSNWTLETTRILLDNTAPAANADSFGGITGNNTIAASMTATLFDANSGIDVSSIRYQWVNVGSELGIDWASAVDINSTDVSGGLDGAEYGKASVTFTAETKDLVFESGEYVLYVECKDTAGNEVILNSGETTIKVNMNNTITCDFGPEGSETTYRKNIIPELTVTGMLISKVEYAISRDTTRPTEGYTEIASTAADADKMQYTYNLPELTVEDGVWYAHILTTGDTGDAQYFRGTYLVDHTAPEIYVNNTGLSSDGIGLNAQVGIVDALSGPAEKAYYQILKTQESPNVEDEGWLELPADRKITLTGESDVYYVHVKAADKAGNETVAVSKPFEIKAFSDEPMELPVYSSQIITVSDGYGIANLVLDSENKEGYRYSISTDGGNKWCNWLPYMSMTRIKLPSDYTASGKLKVKFRAPDGTVGEPQNIIADAIVNEPIWATAEFDSTLKRQTGKTLTFIMTLSENTEYRLTGTDEWKTGNFAVTENGVYSFELKKGATVAATAFTVVVDIFDDTAPAAYLSYSEIAPTNSNVLVTVNCGEPVYVKNISVRLDGASGEVNAPAKMQYSFTGNGIAEFTVCDEAGNETVLIADVTNIDKTAPKVKITENYDRFIFKNSMASGVTLTVEKQDSDDEDFTVIGTNQSYYVDVTENGTYSFTVADAVGNVTKVSKTVENIVHDFPQYHMSYTYAVSGYGVSKDSPKKEDVKARVDFEEVADGRKLYFGTMPASDGANELSKDEAGRYYTSRTYSENGNSTIVVCDSLGNVLKIPVKIEGIDRKAPRITLNAQQAVITPNRKKLSELTSDEIATLFGSYIASDNAYAPEDIQVSVSRSDDFIKYDEDKGDLGTTGAYTLIYTATDPAGNTARADQPLIIIPGDGLLVQASGAILSGAMTNTAIVPSNQITFSVDPQRMQAMFYGSDKKKVYNKSMRYDIYYVSGLYREGQLKTIASKLTAEELVSKNFSVSFPKAGWYTIIIRNQERTREYTTFFVSSYKN